jgi:hypothetical protein
MSLTKALGALALVTAGFLGGALTENNAPDGAKPAESIIEPAAEEVVGHSPTSPCPGGWRDTSTKDEHQRVLSCSKDGWLVILNEDGSFNYAWDGVSPDFVRDPALVPGW